MLAPLLLFRSGCKWRDSCRRRNRCVRSWLVGSHCIAFRLSIASSRACPGVVYCAPGSGLGLTVRAENYQGHLSSASVVSPCLLDKCPSPQGLIVRWSVGQPHCQDFGSRKLGRCRALMTDCAACNICTHTDIRCIKYPGTRACRYKGIVAVAYLILTCNFAINAADAIRDGRSISTVYNAVAGGCWLNAGYFSWCVCFLFSSRLRPPPRAAIRNLQA